MVKDGQSLTEDEQGHDQGRQDPLQRKRDPRLDAAQTSSGATGVDEETSAAGQLNGRATSKTTGSSHLARKITGVAGTLLIAFCSWALVVYLQGGDPLLALDGNAGQEIAATDVGSTAGSHDAGSASSKASSGSSKEGSSADGSAGSPNDGSASSSDSDAASSDQQASSGKSGKATSNSSSSAGAGASAGTSSSGASSSTSSSSNKGSSPSYSSGTSSSSGTASSPVRPAQSNTITVSVSAGGSSSRLTLSKGATAYDALLALGVGVNAENTQYGVYVTAINGVAADANHGWTYTVNGVMPNVSAGGYTLSDGDSVVWTYVTVN